ncbi:MAG: hypothetical protein EOO68_20370 [Moraxellaceae bacterium]|nr:MAG: hypothetical protein EOO68_20370 [Moraxellaceae bacterium]
MNSKQILLGILGLGAVALVAAYFFGAEDKLEVASMVETPSEKTNNAQVYGDDRTRTGATQMQSTTKAATKKVDYRYMQERLTAMQERRPNMTFDPAEVAAAIERDVAWQPLKETPKELPLEPEQFTDGREFISFDSLKIETLMPGDRVRIPIKGVGKEYEITVDSVEKHDYNSISWNGHIEGGDGRNYSVSFTRGATLTVGGMDTPDGQYQLQAHGDKGWIASAGLLFKNHSDPIDPATVIDPGKVDPNKATPDDHSTHTH